MAETSLDKQKIKVLLLEGVHATALNTLKEAVYRNVEEVSRALNETELCEKIKGVHILGIRSRIQITQAVIAAADKLMAIGYFCIGTN